MLKPLHGALVLKPSVSLALGRAGAPPFILALSAHRQPDQDIGRESYTASTPLVEISGPAAQP